MGWQGASQESAAVRPFPGPQEPCSTCPTPRTTAGSRCCGPGASDASSSRSRRRSGCSSGGRSRGGGAGRGGGQGWGGASRRLPLQGDAQRPGAAVQDDLQPHQLQPRGAHGPGRRHAGAHGPASGEPRPLPPHPLPVAPQGFVAVTVSYRVMRKPLSKTTAGTAQ